ncbi:hypothetical protein BDW22DRAFT_1353766 [Trametopsis cervina]|nr:hypothetical protein BDW22DRAFT_1353766 [Trametopsis cervina]
MARCKPVFPSLNSSPTPAPSVSSSSPTQPQRKVGLIERSARGHARIHGLPEELSPPSRSPSPTSRSRSMTFRAKVAEVVAEAGTPANPSWVHVSRSLRMACTSRIYRGGVPQGVRIGEKRKIEHGNYEWVLPDTEEQWEQGEEKWERRFSSEGKASKYWPPVSPSKAELVRSKVRAWQATVVPVVADVQAGAAAASSIALEKSNDAGPSQLRQSPIMFPVVKHPANATNAKSEKIRGTPVKDVSVPESRLQDRHRSPSPAAARIAEVSETPFLPPSFPPQLATSTPMPFDKAKVTHKARAKPRPILPLKPSDSSPSSSPRLPNSAINRIPVPLDTSLRSQSAGRSSPIPRGKRSPLPPPRRSPSHQPVNDEPVSKKPRTSPDPFVESRVSPLQLTHPRPTTPPRTPSPRILEGLGNARGPPVTPEQNGLPTLTDLLASSRRSRPRPRPPSRKNRHSSVGTHETGENPSAHGAREPSPAPTATSRARTVFSSPASGSSDSPQSLRARPRSPVSPLFPSTFAPPFTSTQHGVGAAGFGAMAASQHALTRGNGGTFGMGYSSQYDIEGQVGMVSDILERDVDFDGWLRDIPEVDAE